jgi:hypothetical protein
MSTWISKALLLLLLGACVAIPGRQQQEGITLSGVKLAGPPGFCALPDTRQTIAGAGFVAFAPCDGRTAAVLSATVGDEGSAEGITLTKDALGPYFVTDQGRAALRGAGNTDVVAVQGVSEHRGSVILRLTRQSGGPPVTAWRALMAVDGRLVTLSLRPRCGQVVATDQGRLQMTRFVDALRRGNATPDPAP